MQLSLPVIMITAYGEIDMAVTAMKAGAFDFLQKTVRPNELLESIKDALDYSDKRPEQSADRRMAAVKIESLTSRQRYPRNGFGRQPEQEHRDRLANQPADGGQSPRRDYAESRRQVAVRFDPRCARRQMSGG